MNDDELSDDERRAAQAVGEICVKIADATDGMTPEDVYEAQFEGRDYEVSITVDDDGNETVKVTFLDEGEQ